MTRILRRSLFGASLFLVLLVSSAWGAIPREALSAKPASSLYAVLNVDDLGGLVRTVLSSENIDLFAPLMDEDTLNGVRMASAIVSKMPVRTAALVVGTDENLAPFLQIALDLPEDLKPNLELVSGGKAKGEDIVSLILGDGALAFGPLVDAAPQEGAQGVWYSLNGQLALTARDGLLLIGLSPADLESSLKALAASEERLAVKLRHESKNFSLLHMDFPTLFKIAKEQEAKEKQDGEGRKKFDEIDMDALKKFFRAPLEVEYGFERKPDRFLISMAANLEEAMDGTFLERIRKMKAVPGGDLFLAGAGRPLLALSSKMSFKGSDIEVYPEIAKLWKKGMAYLAEYGVSESEVENLLSGSVSLACGGSAAFAGTQTPGAYLALTGRDGAAASIFKKITENENFATMLHTVPIEVKGWQTVLQVDPSMAPVPALLGVKDETLFLGLQDAAGLNAAPEVSERLKTLLEKDSIGTSFADFEAIRAALAALVNAPDSPVSALLPPPILSSVKDVLGAELSVPFVSIWAPHYSEGFAEFSLVDVAPEKGLMAKVVEVAAQFVASEEE